MVFDEATSSLDSITEKAITKTIQRHKEVQPNLIIIMVAHRLSTIAHADMIYVLEKGKIAEQGNHNSLCERKDCMQHSGENRAALARIYKRYTDQVFNSETH